MTTKTSKTAKASKSDSEGTTAEGTTTPEPATTPNRTTAKILTEFSDVLEGGGVAQGAKIHVTLPTFGDPPVAELDAAEAESLRQASKGDTFAFPAARAFRIEDGRYVTAREVKVVGAGKDGSDVTLEVLA